LYALIFQDIVTTPNEFDEEVAALKTKQAVASKKNYTPKHYDDNYGYYDTPSPGNYSLPESKGSLFYFDPNTLSADGWRRLGLREKTIATIQNYISKGGKFRQPDDIKKIWGLFPRDAERLMPYIQIANTVKNIVSPGKNVGEYRSPWKDSKRGVKPIAINESDTTAWIALPGIGSKLSQRIVNFRSKLGGFYNIEQVGETFGLPDSTFQIIKPLLRLSGEVKKINLNSATIEELKSHPYIRYQLANALVQYKLQHGDYKTVEDIKRIMIVTDELFNKVSPYLTVD
jgi:competence ComEA-like helix-hairpin-helix protein